MLNNVIITISLRAYDMPTPFRHSNVTDSKAQDSVSKLIINYNL